MVNRVLQVGSLVFLAFKLAPAARGAATEGGGEPRADAFGKWLWVKTPYPR